MINYQQDLNDLEVADENYIEEKKNYVHEQNMRAENDQQDLNENVIKTKVKMPLVIEFLNKNTQEANDILDKLKVQLQILEGKEKKIIEKRKESQKILCLIKVFEEIEEF